MNIKCIQSIKASNKTVIFLKNKIYDVHAIVGTLIIIKDETGCLREIAKHKDGDVILAKQFKDVFSITVEEIQ